MHNNMNIITASMIIIEIITEVTFYQCRASWGVELAGEWTLGGKVAGSGRCRDWTLPGVDLKKILFAILRKNTQT